eukprot:21567-Heterococcus_DN1.PRE.7
MTRGVNHVLKNNIDFQSDALGSAPSLVSCHLCQVACTVYPYEQRTLAVLLDTLHPHWRQWRKVKLLHTEYVSHATQAQVVVTSYKWYKSLQVGERCLALPVGWGTNSTMLPATVVARTSICTAGHVMLTGIYAVLFCPRAYKLSPLQCHNSYPYVKFDTPPVIDEAVLRRYKIADINSYPVQLTEVMPLPEED